MTCPMAGFNLSWFGTKEDLDLRVEEYCDRTSQSSPLLAETFADSEGIYMNRNSEMCTWS